jgi:hypothetical protein
MQGKLLAGLGDWDGRLCNMLMCRPSGRGL